VLLAPDHLVDLGQALAQHVLGLRLQGQVERGVDGQVLGGEVLLVVALGELLLDEVDEIRRVRSVEGGALHAYGLRDRRLRRGLVHEARLLHGPQHLVAALRRALGVAVRVVGIRGLDHAREQGGLREREVAHVLVEVHPRGLTHAADAERADLAEVDLVEIQLEDVLLVRAPFEDEGEKGLLGLAPEALLRGEEEVLHQLLGDGAAALDVRLRLDVADGGAHDAEGIEPGMGEEAPVLDGEHGLDEVVRVLLVVDGALLLARLVEQVGDQLGLQRDRRVAALGLQAAHLLHAVLVELDEQGFAGPPPAA
jgi:hypothetical protein